MKGDFTRDTFDPAKHFSRVLSQQGRVTLDADSNEQTSILLHYVRTLARDLIGPYGAPRDAAGFALSYDDKTANLVIGAGRAYVDGILIENDEGCTYLTQPDYPAAAVDPFAKVLAKPLAGTFWLYLDVWERHITCIEDDDIREKALNGPDTCTRSQVVWQIKAIDVAGGVPNPLDAAGCAGPLSSLMTVSLATLAARVEPGQKTTSPCVVPPASKYRGTENHLYRVEIHDGGSAASATFKWSRDNGSVATAWVDQMGHALEVAHSRGFDEGIWVELSDDSSDLLGQPGLLVKLAKVEGGTLTPVSAAAAEALWQNPLVNPKVRRWDQRSPTGKIPVVENEWINLEDGVQVRFASTGDYRSGDYWLIPARFATGAVEWPLTLDPDGSPLTDADGNMVPSALPPDGIEHHYAPLGFFTADRKSKVDSCTCVFDPAGACFRTGPFATGTSLIRPLNFEARLRMGDKVEAAKDTAKVVKRRGRKPS